MRGSAELQPPVLVDTDSARPQRWGWGLLILGFGGFLAWALLAPLDAGISATGTVVVTGSRKVVQPMVPGKIAAILAKDGDQVTAGQVLIRFDETQSRSQLDIYKGQWFTSLATEARLTAERTARETPEFPSTLKNEKSDPRALAAMALQDQLFITRRKSLSSELAAMRENMRGLELQVQGTEASRQAKEEQLKILQEQLKNLRNLADDGFMPRTRVLDQERANSAMLGAIAEDNGSIGRSRQAIAEIKIRMVTRDQEVRKEVESQLSDVQRDASSLGSRLEGLQFDVLNTEIKSPATGLVMGLSVHTVGGVVPAGSPLMEIVPRDEVLKIEAQIPPHLIDKIKPGLPVDILFTAFDQVSTPKVAGRLTQVSADVLMDPKTNLLFFKASIDVTTEGMVKLKKNEIRAGMPAEIFVRTGERTAMNYLLKPLLDRVRRSMTEP
ncbi:HlyD family type I secretion periplasmic adaptor subunit [Polaromonas eurypsychrophila]|uniref:HlyD family type I secretion periplasmic adaptor subunit n=1 Tax=Polaromonas eurypsychrophila TaxID=1614635 RepID=UPI001666C34E|nr:HlyD family type I secretion periplasmic adaptor subunit [Polaromonas eurypsychrophila]